MKFLDQGRSTESFRRLELSQVSNAYVATEINGVKSITQMRDGKMEFIGFTKPSKSLDRGTMRSSSYYPLPSM